MAFEDFTPVEQRLVLDFTTYLRAHGGEQQAWQNDGQTVLEQWFGGVSDVVAKLRPEDVVPNGSTLAGTVGLTANEITGLVATVQGADTNYNTEADKTVRIKGAGVNAFRSRTRGKPDLPDIKEGPVRPTVRPTVRPGRP